VIVVNECQILVAGCATYEFEQIGTWLFPVIAPIVNNPGPALAIRKIDVTDKREPYL
jgi:hypothetical protein